MKTIRMCGLSKSNWNAMTSSAGCGFGHHSFAGCHFTLPHRRTAFGAEIIENLAIGQN
jgi:hypothetical protein